MAQIPSGEVHYIVAESALPEVLQKVCRVQSLLDLGEETNTLAATQAVGISRSAYYKYKELIRPFHQVFQGRIFSLSLVLGQSPEVLSSVLGVFSSQGARVLSLHQNLPRDHAVVVEISGEIIGESGSAMELCSLVAKLPGVLACQPLLARE